MPNHFRRLVFQLITAITMVAVLFPAQGLARAASTFAPLPVVAIHVSELTQALESMPAAGTDTPQPPSTPNTSGKQWFYTSWHYFVMYESLKEALRSDGTPFVTISDADISAGALLQPDGTPKYPILISLASEAVADDEIAPLKAFVRAGGFLLAGSSAFTRNPDGSTRRDFALADVMGLHTASPSLLNWYANQSFSKVFNHRLVSHIPAGNLTWSFPLAADETHWGTAAYGHFVRGALYDFRVSVTDATVVVRGSQSPLLTVKQHGRGTVIYHSDMQPLIGFGGADAGMYAYGIYRNAIEWAFAAVKMPLVKVSPWRYTYNSAFIIRHDMEDSGGRGIEASARAEFEAGAKGDYYFCTGVLRDNYKNDPTIVASLRRAAALYGATIGPHNGGLKNPNNPSLTTDYFEYWHWGPDEALNGTQAGFEYALKSVAISYQDIDRWLAGTDNGRTGCGAAGNCPHIWTSPYFNSTREESNIILEQLNTLSMGEQKLSPLPHFTVSFNTPGLRYPQVSLPVSDWFVGNNVAHSIESGHTVETVHTLVDSYYRMGYLVNLYGHNSSASGLTYEYMRYSLSKPHMWATNSVEIADWWALRARVSITPEYRTRGGQVIITATVEGAIDPETAIELVIPRWNLEESGAPLIYLNGELAQVDDYRYTPVGLKIRVGSSIHLVEVRYRPVERFDRRSLY